MMQVRLISLKATVKIRHRLENRKEKPALKMFPLTQKIFTLSIIYIKNSHSDSFKSLSGP